VKPVKERALKEVLQGKGRGTRKEALAGGIDGGDAVLRASCCRSYDQEAEQREAAEKWAQGQHGESLWSR
jgi:hypothetical protein